jgi:hypothetical protein
VVGHRFDDLLRMGVRPAGHVAAQGKVTAPMRPTLVRSCS